MIKYTEMTIPIPRDLHGPCKNNRIFLILRNKKSIIKMMVIVEHQNIPSFTFSTAPLKKESVKFLR